MLYVQVRFVGARPSGFNIGSIVLANAGIALAVVAALPLMRGRDRHDLWLLAAPVLALVIVWMTRSRGPLLAIPPLFLIITFFVWRVRLREVKWFPFLALAIIIVLLLLAIALMSRGERSVTELLSEVFTGSDITNTGARARVVLQEAGWRAFLDSPWIGHGWAHLMDAVAPYLRPEDAEFARLPQLHNDVLNFAVSGGIVGIACYVAILVSPTIAAWRSARDSLYTVRLFGTFALLVVYATAGLTDLMFGHEFHTAFFVTLNAIILGMCRDAPRPPISSPGASCDKVCLRALAILASASTPARTFGASARAPIDEFFSSARVPLRPLEYLPESTPCANGEKGMTPMPSSPHVSSVWSSSIQRLRIE
jgi:O-antigen ligase